MRRKRTASLAAAGLLLGLTLLAIPRAAGDQFSLIAAGSEWMYWDSVEYPGDDWRTPSYDDGSWSNGTAMLGFGDANGVLPVTPIANNGQWASYFRRAFTVADPSLFTSLALSLQRDDGAVVWLNGVEVWRQNMPASGSILSNTPASSVASGADESRWWTTTAAANLLVPGTNVAAVEVHQISLSSSDLIFDFSLEGINDNARPVIAAPNDSLLSEAPASVRLSATASDDGQPLPADTGNPDPNDPHKLRWGWTAVEVPATSSGVVWSGNAASGEAFTYAGSSNAPGTVFTCDPTATFDVPGRYVLAFAADDGEKQTNAQVAVTIITTGDYRSKGYLYLSPVPRAEYTSPQTRFVLVRFSRFPPSAVTNLPTFVTVAGATSGNHTGTTHVAGDGRTVIFTMTQNFTANELVTVSLNPAVDPAQGSIEPYSYTFAVAGPMPDAGIVTARGETPPYTKEKAFDQLDGTHWRDPIVPDGSTNFSWIQYAYPGSDRRIVDRYALTSAVDSPEGDPADWRVYGVDGSGALTLLDTQTGQTFGSRSEAKTFSITNWTAFRGYRLEITRVNDTNTATGVQLAELVLTERVGSLLREYWTGINGAAVSDLTSNTNYPDNPSGSNQISSFETPIDWADYYGTRLRGYLTAPGTGNYTFWIASDDGGQLWLSTNESPAEAAMIASVAEWTYSREWAKFASQKSAPISLVAGQRYYIEALQKEHGGSDNLAVGWAKPGEATSLPSEVIPGAVLSPWTGGSPVSPAPARQAALDVPATEAAKPFAAAASLPVASPGQAGLMPNGVSVPSDFPHISITTNDNPDPGYIFLDNRGGGGKPYNVIFDNSGSPIWYQKMPDERRDMKVQPNGVLTMVARDGGVHFNGLNSNYVQIATYRGVNGHGVDEHELTVLEDGTYFLIGLRANTVDMTRYVTGGNAAASVTEQVIQEFTAAGELIFQWRAWDNFDILDQQSFINIRSASFDFPHMNAIDVDTDGHILLSSRSISEITKINRDTGEIIWRLGGVHNQFTYVNDPLGGPRNQHAIRALGNNRYTLFDNGNQHSPPVSRAVEYEIDPTNMTATVVWQYPATPTTALYSFYMGNAQRLPNGNTLINWAVGNLPKLTEVRPDGTKAFEMNWVSQFEAYRVWRCAWQGMALKPNLIVESYPDRVLLLFNKFGDADVKQYRIYGGTSPSPTGVLAVSSVALASLSSLENKRQYYFRVTAVDGAGTESEFSDELSVYVDLVKPGENLVRNPDFSLGTNSWIWSVSGTAAGSWTTNGGAAYADITSPGLALTDVHLRQAGMRLLQGREYVLQFDAWSPQPRAIEVRLGQDQSPWTAYKVVSPFLTPVRQRFKYPFVMTSANDLNARLSFNLGTSLIDVYLDDVALFMVAPGDFNRDGRVDYLDLDILTAEWLKEGGALTSDLNGDGKVDFEDFEIFGQNWTGAGSNP
jgi:hypothetical protein